MNNSTKRGFLASVGAMATAAALALGGAVAAHATSEGQPIPESSDVTITKLAQPDSLGNPATGEQISTDDYTGIGGVEFDYYLVDDTGPGDDYDIGTNDGQEHAAGLTPETAAVGTTATGTFPATNSPSGVTTHTLDRGLYLVQENPATVPAGVTPAAPFLLAVPLTDPTNLNAWLDHIYVYPKNSQITGEKTVINSGANQVVVGSDVTWTINTDIPRVENPAYDGTDANPQFIAPDLFRIDDTLQANQLALSPTFATGDNASISVTAGETVLVEGTDYDITEVPVGEPATAQTYQILFTETGREALAAAVNADSNAQVTIELTTTVLAADEIENSASVYPNSDSVTENNPLEIPGTDIRYGSVDFTKLSPGADVVDLSGAVFELYATEDAAKTLDQDYRLTPTDNTGTVQDNWTTDADGNFSVEGLRYSGYADGESFDATDDRYQTYWIAEVVALDGHQLLPEPLEIVVTGDRVADGFEIRNQDNTGGFELPLTGGMGTAFLTIAGIAILAIVLMVARRRRAAAITTD